MCALTRRDAADVRPSVTATDYRVTELQNAAAEARQVEKTESYFREIVTDALCGIYYIAAGSPIDPGLITGMVEASECSCTTWN